MPEKLRIAIGPGASREFGGRAKPARLLNGVASAALAAQVRFAGANRYGRPPMESRR